VGADPEGCARPGLPDRVVVHRGVHSNHMQVPSFPDLRGDDHSPDAYLGGELSLPWVIAAYESGFFPWPMEDEPLAWWCPRTRMIFEVDGLHVSRSLQRTLRRGRFQFSLDRDFSGVLARCRDQRGPGRDGTWITDEITEVYEQLHQLGLGHSLEVWEEEVLVGGVYGLALGQVFFGESMFSDRTDASKAGLAVLTAQLRIWGFEMLDCQVPNEHLIRMGGKAVPRCDFLDRLATGLRAPTCLGRWELDPMGPWHSAGGH
jgi:leucyl/phenylalanyl-tRNA--protein transferase